MDAQSLTVDGDQISKRRIRAMLNPGSAVFIGGSNLETAIANTRRKGFQGAIYVVNPYHSQIAGINCFKGVSELPEVPDLGFVSVPKEHVIDAVKALGRLSVAATICNSAGFSEIKQQGIERQNELVEAAGEMPLLGPNCPGFANFLDNAVFMQDHFGDHEAVDDGVAVISNGGAYLSDLGCARRSLNVGYLIGVGNQAMLSVGRMLDVVLDDPRVKAVNLYIESLHDVPALSRAALKAIHQDVPVVVVKGGRTYAGGRAAQTHTASIAGDNVIASALFKRLGFVETDNPVQAIETLKMMVCTRRPAGPRVAFATSSGSYAVLGGDAAAQASLSVPEMPASLVDAIQPRLPQFILASNPLDISEAQFESDETHKQIFSTFLAGDNYDIALLVMCFPPPGGWESESWYRVAASYAKAAGQQGLPCAFVNTIAEDLPEDARIMMINHGMAPLMGMDHGIQAIGAAVRQAKWVNDLKQESKEHVVLSDYSRLQSDPITLDEAEAKLQLSQHGIAVPPNQVVSIESIQECKNMDYPVVLKALAPGLLHKSEIGAVSMDIYNIDDLHQAMVAMTKGLAQTAPQFATGAFLVEQKITDCVAELLVGIRYIDDMGFVLTLAFGGVNVELVNDAATLLLPASRETMADAIRQLKLFPLLNGWRGRPNADIDAAVDTIHALADFSLLHSQRLDTLEVNPLLVRQQGRGAVVVDAVLSLRQDR